MQQACIFAWWPFGVYFRQVVCVAKDARTTADCRGHLQILVANASKICHDISVTAAQIKKLISLQLFQHSFRVVHNGVLRPAIFKATCTNNQPT